MARLGDRRGAYTILVGKPEGKRPLGRRRCRWEDNIKTELKEISSEGVELIYLAHNKDRWRAVVNTVTNFQFPQNAGYFLST